MNRRNPNGRALVIGRVVHYMPTEDYECPAMVIGTQKTFNNVFPGADNLKRDEVILSVMDPDPEEEDGAYRAWNVPHDPHMGEDTYHWPDECEE